MKPYKKGLLVGRFQMIHSGHTDMIESALRLCDNVLILVGSSQESGTEKNPFSYEVRESTLKKLFDDKLIIAPLPDIGVGNTQKWGEYVLETAAKYLGGLPDLFVSGKEDRRTSWFSGDLGDGIAELYIPKTIQISATAMRQMLIDDDFNTWKQYVSPALYNDYNSFRNTVLLSADNKFTKSV